MRADSIGPILKKPLCGIIRSRSASALTRLVPCEPVPSRVAGGIWQTRPSSSTHPGRAPPYRWKTTVRLSHFCAAWRARALHVLLIVIVVASLPAYILTLSNAIRSGQISAAVWVYPAVYIAFVVLAGLPRLDFGLRAWSLLLLCDANAWASFARNGLAGSGRLYLIVVPIVATVLLGSPAGYLFAALSLAIYAVFALLAHFGALGQWLTVEANPLALAYWAEAGVALAAFLVVVVVLLDRLFRLQRRVLAARRQAVAESMRTALALQTAYQTLERRVEERTHALATLNAIASTVSRSLDLDAILSDALDKTLEVIGAPAGAAYCLEDATQTFVLAAHRGLPDAGAADQQPQPAGDGAGREDAHPGCTGYLGCRNRLSARPAEREYASRRSEHRDRHPAGGEGETGRLPFLEHVCVAFPGSRRSRTLDGDRTADWCGH